MKITDGTPYIDDIRQLITDYNKALGLDLSFQDIETELADLPAKYSPPDGRLYCALADNGEVIGCIAYHRHSDDRCEMKRLFVRPEFRELHAGRQLIEKLLEAAKADGYSEMVLDTITPLQSAIHLYKKYGFEECGTYYNNPMDDVVYMKKKL